MIGIGIQKTVQSLNMYHTLSRFAGCFERRQAWHADILLHRYKARERHMDGFNYILQMLLGVHPVPHRFQASNPCRVGNAQMLAIAGPT